MRAPSPLLRFAMLALLAVGAVSMVVPLLSALSLALEPPTARITGLPLFFPTRFYWPNFIAGWKDLNMGQLFGNSLVVSLGTVAGQSIIALMAAYSISRVRMPGSRFLLYFFVSTMFLAESVLLLPIFLVLSQLGLLNTLLGIVVPKLAWGLSVLFFVRTMDAIPREYDEAANIDGAGDWRILWRVILPQMWPAIATMAIETFVGTWNDFLLPLVVVSSSSKYTVSLGLLELGGPNVGVLPQIRMAATLIAMLPALFIFLVLQRLFMQAVGVGGIKG